MDRKTYSRDIYSKFWATAREEHSFSQEFQKYEKNLQKYICEHVPKDGKLLDVAIGNGFPFGNYFQKAGYNVSGVDIAPKLIEKCRQLYPNIDSKVGDAEDLDYPDEYFDCVYCFNSTFYFSNLNKAIDEMLRVTRSGGLVIYDIKNRNNKSVENAYNKCVYQNSGVGRIIRYMKNMAKVICRRGTSIWDWNAIVHEVPTFPESIYDHLEKRSIISFQVIVKKNDGSLDIKKRIDSFREFGRLSFVVRK